MPTPLEVEEFALGLSESERANLAARLWESLPLPLYDDDEGVAEALRRDAELDNDPDSGMSREEFDEKLRRLLS